VVVTRERNMFLRYQIERQARGSALLYPPLPGPAQEPEVLLRAPFNSLRSDRRIKHVAISAGSVGFQVRSRTLGLNLNLKPSVRLGLYLTSTRRRRSRSKG
jgi:hypothetical protein